MVEVSQEVPESIGDTMSNRKNIVVLGPPGAGKGTQCEKISETYDIPHISTGKMLREHKDLETEHGTARDYMEKGDLVPDRVVYRILDHRLEKNDTKQGFVLDGFPRDMEQAKHLEERRELDLVISLEVDQEEIMVRLTGRRVCEDCGESFHIKFRPPEEEKVCDECGGDLIHRDDDKREVIEERLEEYRNKTLPLKEFYNDKDLLEEVDGNGSIEEVWKKTRQTLEETL